ncbi:MULTISPECIES: AraC family transcriptional regulator [Sphingobacterium]|uniref:AraC family transcriptional regulator n=1 Tax=Sphingobacterium TaxID=28453 RepID=UPI00257E1D5D|nr:MULTISPECIES: helix-turn-helix domain-containing protein [Sphingobacterium]
MKVSSTRIELFEELQKKTNIYDDIIYMKVVSNDYELIPRGLDFFALILFESGHGVHVIDSVHHKIKPNQLHLLFPGQYHSWMVTKQLSIHLLFISKRLLNTFQDNFVYPLEFYKKFPVVYLNTDIFKRLKFGFEGIRDEIQLDTPMKEIIFTQLRIITLHISREAISAFDRISGTSNPILERFTALVLSNFRKHRKIYYYAQALNISANYLNVLVKKHFGTTATSFLYKEIINEVKYELLYSNKQIKEIALGFNFSDMPTFTTFFKNNTGVSPKAFIEMTKSSEPENGT